MKRVAALDFGTNTFLLLVADVESGKIKNVLHDEVRVVRLGQDVNRSKKFHPEALERARACLADFAKTIRSLKVETTLACATSAARDVTNAKELFEIAKSFDIPLEIISGEREAELTFSGTIDGTEKGSVAIIDVGGGSTEFIFGSAAGLKSRVSVDVGSVRLTEMFVTKHPVADSEVLAMKRFIAEKIAASLPAKMIEKSDTVIAVAGTPTTLAAVDQAHEFESDLVHGYRLSIAALKKWAETLAKMTVEERQKLAGMEPKRADVIVAGANVLLGASEALGAKELVVSVRGLRYGIARSLA